MKTSLSLIFLFIFCLSANGQSVGVNTTNPDPSAALDVQSFDQGILVPRLKESARLNIQNPATGLLVYDIDLLRFYTYDGVKWVGLSTTDAFINEFGIVRNDGDLGNDILLFAADQLPGSGSDDTLMMFHTPTGSFRAGRPSSNFWIVDSLGNFSFAVGSGVKASGNYSASVGTGNQSIGEASFTAGIGNDATDSYATAIGRMNDATGFGSLATGSENLASGQYATAMGNFTEASGSNATAMGSQTRAVGGQSIAMGIQSEAIGNYSTAMGRTTKAESKTSTVMGRFNVGGGHPSIWQDPDPLLEVGNGSDAANLHNAFTVLKGGKTGIGTATPDTNFSVIGVSRAAFDESETDFIEMSHGGGNAFINAAGAGNIDIRHEGTNIMTIAQNHRVGIGTNSPDTDLSVIGKVRAAIQSNENEYTEIFHGGDNGYINTVGDGDLQFRHDDNTVMSLNDGGDLSVDGQLTLGSANANLDYTFPGSDGNVNQYLKTDGNGNLSWVNLTNSPFTDVGQSIVPASGSLADNFMVGGNVVPGLNTTEKMIYYNDDHNALRHGYINASDQWDPSNLGEGSFATGYNVLASGNYAVAIGDRTDATGNDAFATGENTVASGLRSASFGDNTTASGENAFAVGWTGNATGKNSFKSGWNTFANGDNSATFGVGNTAGGYASLAAGDGNIVNARSSMALGAGLETNSYGCFAIGAFNEGNGSNPDIWVGTASEPIFEIGVGTSITRKNALTVNKAGSVAIGNSAASAILSVDAGGTAPLFIVERNNDDIFKIDGDDKIQIYKESIFHDRLDLWPQVDRLVQYRIELPNIATIEDGTAVAYNWDTYSDKRVKKNIEEIPYGLDAVLALNPVKYHHHSTDYKDGFILRDDYREEIGFIAQETYKVIKEVVHKPEDESKALWTMNYEKLTPVLVKAIQEQQAIIESLQKQLSEKDTEMKDLRSDVNKILSMLEGNN